MSLAPEGRPFIGAGLALAVLFLLLGLVLGGAENVSQASSGSALFWGRVCLWAAGVLGVLTAFVVFFFRSPHRTPPEDPRAVVAPGDGLVVQIAEIAHAEFLEGPAIRVSIFLSLFDVHVQRSPLAGTVRHRSYRKGGFAAAWNARASEENEQATLGIASGPHRVLVRQIAGLVARRVVTDPEEGEGVERGERIGLIRFGSRVDLFVPSHWDVTCARGDRARGGESVMALMPPAGEGA
jgi:phosphatidylserine decarboxylase